LFVSYKIKKNKAEIEIDNAEKIYFEGSQDFDIIDGRFALLAVCPLAMSRGENIQCNFFIEKQYIDIIKEVCFHWALTCPEIYSYPEIIVEEKSSKVEPKNNNLIFFSGGVDSSYTAIRKFDSGITSDCLIVHGMDYKVADDIKFNDLLQSTSTFRKKYFANTITVKTNLHQFYSGKCNPVDGSVTHFFNLISAAWLFSSKYSSIQMASDYNLSLQNVVHPYGSNSGVFQKFSNLNQKITLCDDNVLRSEKLQFLLGREFSDIQGLSFCTDYNSRPYNCGLCSKCMRTKVMCFALTGEVPDIFSNKQIPKSWARSLNLKRKPQIAHLMDALTCIHKSDYRENLDYHSTLKMFNKVVSKQRKISSKVNGLENAMLIRVLSKIKKFFSSR